MARPTRPHRSDHGARKGPVTLDDRARRDLARALAHHKSGQLDQAAVLYRGVLERTPDHADTLQLLGALEGQAGRTERALTLLQQAVAADPAHGRAHNNLGKVLTALGRHEEAWASFERAATLMPNSTTALANCGRSLRALGRLEEAVAAFDRVLALEPDSADALAQRADLLERLARRDPQWRDAALQALDRVQGQTPNPEMFEFVRAAIAHQQGPAAAPRDFVAQLFDAHADEFDAHLVGNLKYRTPELVEEAIVRAGVPPAGPVLDLGCGTGLCGRFLKPWSTHLTGIDLSPRMLDKARERGLYDTLVCGELLDHLRTVNDAPRLVVAADVFVYVGDLAPVTAAVGGCLHAEGLFVFSVEAHDGDGYALTAARRYAHSEAYLRQLASAHGFAEPQIDRVVLREQAGDPVRGLLATFRLAPPGR